MPQDDLKTGTLADTPLYHDPALYQRLFPLDDEELQFWKGLVGGRGGALLDIGAGPSPLSRQLTAELPVAVDISAPMLRGGGQKKNCVQADASALPLANHSIQTVICRLFGIAYAAAPHPVTNFPRLAAELRRVIAPSGVAALELPLAHKPRKLQGLEERYEIEPGVHYAFRYFEVTDEHEFGARLDTQITVQSCSQIWETSAPLFVFTPAGALTWANLAGLEGVEFYASYDLQTRTGTPPADVLRGVLVGQRGSAA